MKKHLKIASLSLGIALALTGTAALAEQTIGVQTVAATPAIATAKVNVRVIVPKIVILRVGAADGTVSDVNFTVGLNPVVLGAPGNSLAYTAGPIPPGLTSAVATTNPATAAGALTVGAWTNGATGATLSCALTALGGTTAPFATGATAAGVPGTSDITVASVAGAGNLQHPGPTLAACDGTTTSAIARLAPLSGTFTYALLATNLALMATGTYGNIVTYTATAP